MRTLSIKKPIVTILLIFFTLVEVLAQIPAGYYDSAAGKTGAELKAALHNIIKGHIGYSYGEARYLLAKTDRDSADSPNVRIIYSNHIVSGAWDGGITWNREHVWAKSRGFIEIDNNTIGVGSDLHNLRSCIPEVNSARNNRWFAECSSPYIYNGEATGSYTSSSQWIWKPRNEDKGDVARIMFYMAVRYEVGGSEPDLELVDYFPPDSTRDPLYAKLSALLQWHIEDTVDSWERGRNEVIYSYQHNRNPFIDHPEYVALIWGSNLPPLAPSNLSAETITQTSVTLTWSDNSLDETGFRIYQDDDSLTTTAANVTTYFVENLTPATHYVFTITAINQNGESSGATLQLVTSSDDTTADKVFFSEYIEGGSYNKALEIVNASTAAVVLSDYAIISNYNNNSWNTNHYSFPSGTILESGEVWVIANSGANQKIITVADDTLASLSAGGVVNFNGNDVRALVKITESDTVIIDVIGLYNDPALTDGWQVAGVSAATKDHTLIRKPCIRKGNPDWISSAGTNNDDSEWLVYETDTFDYLGAHELEPINHDAIWITGAKPVAYRLYANYPNPFNPFTTIRYDLLRETTVTLTIYNLKGAIVNNLVHEKQSAGTYDVLWNGCNAENNPAAGGIYLYRFRTADGFAQTGKMILLK